MDKLTYYFREVDTIDTPTSLVPGAMFRVARERRRSILFRHVPVLLLGLMFSLGATVFAIQAAIADAIQSGLANFLTMIVTDSGTVLASWQSYSLTIVDTFPAIQLAGACGALFLFFTLLRRIDGELLGMTKLRS